MHDYSSYLSHSLHGSRFNETVFVIISRSCVSTSRMRSWLNILHCILYTFLSPYMFDSFSGSWISFCHEFPLLLCLPLNLLAIVHSSEGHKRHTHRQSIDEVSGNECLSERKKEIISPWNLFPLNETTRQYEDTVAEKKEVFMLSFIPAFAWELVPHPPILLKRQSHHEGEGVLRLIRIHFPFGEGVSVPRRSSQGVSTTQTKRLILTFKWHRLLWDCLLFCVENSRGKIRTLILTILVEKLETLQVLWRLNFNRISQDFMEEDIRTFCEDYRVDTPNSTHTRSISPFLVVSGRREGSFRISHESLTRTCFPSLGWLISIEKKTWNWKTNFDSWTKRGENLPLVESQRNFETRWES